MIELMACPIDGWADHPWKPRLDGSDICAMYFCYYLAGRHPTKEQEAPRG